MSDINSNDKTGKNLELSVFVDFGQFLALTGDYAAIAGIEPSKSQGQWKKMIKDAAQNYADAYVKLLAENFKNEVSVIEEEKRRRMESLGEAVRDTISHAAAQIHLSMLDVSNNEE